MPRVPATPRSRGLSSGFRQPSISSAAAPGNALADIGNTLAQGSLQVAGAIQRSDRRKAAASKAAASEAAVKKRRTDAAQAKLDKEVQKVRDALVEKAEKAKVAHEHNTSISNTLAGFRLIEENASKTDVNDAMSQAVEEIELLRDIEIAKFTTSGGVEVFRGEFARDADASIRKIATATDARRKSRDTDQRTRTLSLISEAIGEGPDPLDIVNKVTRANKVLALGVANEQISQPESDILRDAMYKDAADSTTARLISEGEILKDPEHAAKGLRDYLDFMKSIGAGELDNTVELALFTKIGGAVTGMKKKAKKAENDAVKEAKHVALASGEGKPMVVDKKVYDGIYHNYIAMTAPLVESGEMSPGEQQMGIVHMAVNMGEVAPTHKAIISNVATKGTPKEVAQVSRLFRIASRIPGGAETLAAAFGDDVLNIFETTNEIAAGSPDGGEAGVVGAAQQARVALLTDPDKIALNKKRIDIGDDGKPYLLSPIVEEMAAATMSEGSLWGGDNVPPGYLADVEVGARSILSLSSEDVRLESTKRAAVATSIKRNAVRLYAHSSTGVAVPGTFKKYAVESAYPLTGTQTSGWYMGELKDRLVEHHPNAYTQESDLSSIRVEIHPLDILRPNTIASKPRYLVWDNGNLITDFEWLPDYERSPAAALQALRLAQNKLKLATTPAPARTIEDVLSGIVPKGIETSDEIGEGAAYVLFNGAPRAVKEIFLMGVDGTLKFLTETAPQVAGEVGTAATAAFHEQRAHDKVNRLIGEIETEETVQAQSEFLGGFTRGLNKELKRMSGVFESKPPEKLPLKNAVVTEYFREMAKEFPNTDASILALEVASAVEELDVQGIDVFDNRGGDPLVADRKRDEFSIWLEQRIFFRQTRGQKNFFAARDIDNFIRAKDF